MKTKPVNFFPTGNYPVNSTQIDCVFTTGLHATGNHPRSSLFPLDTNIEMTTPAVSITPWIKGVPEFAW
jgi:hypothetical protein